MKKALIFIVVFQSLKSFGQESSNPDPILPRTIIKISPVPLFGNTLEVAVESFNRKRSKSFQATAGFLFANDKNYRNSNGLHLEFAYRKYISPMKFYTGDIAPFYHGIYYSFFIAGSYFEGSYVISNQTFFDETSKALSSGFTIGLQQTLFNRILLDVDIGGEFRMQDQDFANQTSYYGNETTYSLQQTFLPKINLRFGVAL